MACAGQGVGFTQGEGAVFELQYGWHGSPQQTIHPTAVLVRVCRRRRASEQWCQSPEQIPWYGYLVVETELVELRMLKGMVTQKVVHELLLKFEPWVG